MNANQPLLDLPWSSLLAGAVSSGVVIEPEANRLGRVIDALIREHGPALKVVSTETIEAHYEVERLLDGAA